MLLIFYLLIQCSAGEAVPFYGIPDNYIQKTRELVEEYSYIPRFGKDKGKLKTVPAHWKEEQKMLPHYHIDKLWTGGKGSGTRAVQDIVIKSNRFNYS